MPDDTDARLIRQLEMSEWTNSEGHNVRTLFLLGYPFRRIRSDVTQLCNPPVNQYNKG